MQFHVVPFSFFLFFYSRYLQYRHDFSQFALSIAFLLVLRISWNRNFLPRTNFSLLYLNSPPYFLFPSAIDRFIPSRFQRIFRFFKKYPEYQRYFTAFMDTPLNELPANKRFQAHCAGVITALNNVIDFLHDPGLMEASLIGLVERHKKRGQTKEEFQVREWKLENRENLIYI